MKKSKKPYIITACISAIVTVVIVLGVLYGLQLMPKGSSFSFDTLGVFLGAIGSVGAIFAIWLTTRKQLMQNAKISYDQNEIQMQNVKISEEQKEIQKQNIKLNLLDKRYEIYISINNFIDLIISEGIYIKDKNSELLIKTINEIKNEFLIKTRNAEFLFEPNVCTLIKELNVKSTKLKIIINQYGRAQKENAPVDNLINEEEKLLHWFEEQLEVTRELFEKYINVTMLGLS